jgi:predicted XRE-type DNA-binding protein
MKISAVRGDARKRCFIVSIKSKEYEFPYSYLEHKPSAKNPLISVTPDKEVNCEALTYRLQNGSGDTILTEQILHYNRDPEIIRKQLLYDLSCQAQELIKNRNLSKRSVARLLGIQPAQLYRILDQSFYGKTIDQMVRLFASLGEKVEIHVKSAA